MRMQCCCFFFSLIICPCLFLRVCVFLHIDFPKVFCAPPTEKAESMAVALFSSPTWGWQVRTLWVSCANRAAASPIDGDVDHQRRERKAGRVNTGTRRSANICVRLNQLIARAANNTDCWTFPHLLLLYEYCRPRLHPHLRPRWSFGLSICHLSHSSRPCLVPSLYFFSHYLPIIMLWLPSRSPRSQYPAPCLFLSLPL